MKNLSSRCQLLALLLTGLLVPSTAMAYIDPSTGGLLFQLMMPVITAVIGAWLFFRRTIANAVIGFWRRVTGKPKQ